MCVFAILNIVKCGCPGIYPTIVENSREEASRHAERAVQLDPDLPEGHLMLARLFLHSGQLEEAQREL